uniref:Uncharacterized protein n=1 Tax=Bos indicus x Bos taurus TaxID=30522 RepID=A0A4W2FPW1_BOBOX
LRKPVRSMEEATLARVSSSVCALMTGVLLAQYMFTSKRKEYVLCIFWNSPEFPAQ